MTDKNDKLKELKEKLCEKVMERMPRGGTRKDVKKILEDLIFGDDDDIDEGEGSEWVR